MKKLKTILCFVLMLVVPIFAFVGCGENNDENNTPPDNSTKVATSTELANALSSAKTGDTIKLTGSTYADDIVIDKQVTIVGGGNNVVLTGAITITSGDVTLKNIKVNHTYTADEEFCKFVISGKNFTIDGVTIQRMTGVAPAYGFLFNYENNEGTVTVKNSTLIAPVAGTAETILLASPSMIGCQGEKAEEFTSKLVVENSVFKTNGMAIFNRWNTSSFTTTTFTGLDASSSWQSMGVEVTTCFMAFNNVHCKDVSFKNCTFTNTRDRVVFAAGGNITLDGCTFENNNSAPIAVCGTVLEYPVVSKLVIKNCTFDLALSNAGITLADAFDENSEATISNNKFKNCSEGATHYTIVNFSDNYNLSTSGKLVVTGSNFNNCHASTQTVNNLTMADFASMMNPQE